MQSALKEAFVPIFKAIINGEMESYLGYEANSLEEKETTNRCNGYFDKTIKTSMGETEIEDKVTKRGAFPNDIRPLMLLLRTDSAAYFLRQLTKSFDNFHFR